MQKKVIITAAITGGVHTPTMSPYLPVTPRQIVEEAVRSYQAGAAVAHIHVRNPETGQPSSDLELYREVVSGIKSKCNIVLCLTTGGGMGQTVEERARALAALKPELGSLNAGSLNFALFPLADNIKNFKFPWEKPFLEATEEFIFPNTFKTLREYSAFFSQSETKPELEIYDVGMINNVAFMIDRGYIKRPPYLQFVMGILGGIPAKVENLAFLYNTARATLGDFMWSVAAAGRYQMPLCTAALAMGGNARIGLEDSLYVAKGALAKSNAEQVEKIIRIAGELSLLPATPDEARVLLGLKGIDKVSY